jgi:metal-responsive CopG/Arc/MetJ family transcriptional regulator
MNQAHLKQRISITVDSQLLQDIDRLTDNRSAAVEQGLRLWRRQQIEEQLRDSYLHPRLEVQQLEEDWAELAQNQMEEILAEQGL